jgi:hypothetical protein
MNCLCVWWILINVDSRQIDAVVRVLLEFQRAVCFLDNISMGNSPDRLTDCVDIVRIPSHEPKKVFQWVLNRSSARWLQLLEEKRKKRTIFKKQTTHSDVKILCFSSASFFWICVDSLDSQLMEFPNQKERYSQQINSGFSSDSLQTHRVEAKRQPQERHFGRSATGYFQFWSVPRDKRRAFS